MKTFLFVLFTCCAAALANATTPTSRVTAEASGQGSVGVVDGNVSIQNGLTLKDIDPVLKAHDHEYQQRLQELTAKVNALGEQQRSREGAAIPEAVVSYLLSILREQRVPRTQWPEKLTDLTQEYAISRSGLRSLKSGDRKTRALLERALDTKDPRLTDELLMEAANSAIEQARKAKRAATQFSREAAQMDVCRAELAILNMDPRNAAAQLETAFNLLADDIDTGAAGWLLQAGDLVLRAGDSGNAIRLYGRALDASTANAARDPTDIGWQRSVASADYALGMALIKGRNIDQAVPHLQESLRIRSMLLSKNPTDSARRRELLLSHRSLATALVTAHKIPEAMTEFDAALEIAIALVAVEPAKPLWQRDLLLISEDIARYRQELGYDADSAARTIDGAIEFARQILENDPANIEWRRNEGLAHELIGFIGFRGNDLDSAGKAQQEALRIYVMLGSEYPQDTQWPSHQMRAHSNIGLVLMEQGHPAAAIAHWRTAIQLAQGLLAVDPTAADWKFMLSTLHQHVGNGLAKLGSGMDATDEYRTADALLSELVAMDPAVSRWQEALWRNDVYVAKQLVAQKSAAGALQRFQQALGRARSIADRTPSDVKWQSHLLESLEYVGDSLRETGNRAGALNSYRAAAEIARRYSQIKDSGNYWRCHFESVSSAIGQIEEEQGHYVLAARQFNLAIRVSDELVTAEPVDVRWQQKLHSAWRAMGALNVKRNRIREALDDYQNSLKVAKRLLDAHPDDALTLNAALLNVWLIRQTYVRGEEDRRLLLRGIDASNHLQATGEITVGQRDEYVRSMQSVAADWSKPSAGMEFTAGWASRAFIAVRRVLVSSIVSRRTSWRSTAIPKSRASRGHLYAKVGDGGSRGICFDEM